MNNYQRAYAFACYADQDMRSVMPVINTLRGLGAAIYTGADAPGYIYQLIDGSSLVMLFVSRESVSSPVVDSLMQYTFRQNKQILRINIDSSPLPGSWAFYMPATIQYASFSSDADGLYGKLINALAARGIMPAQTAGTAGQEKQKKSGSRVGSVLLKLCIAAAVAAAVFFGVSSGYVSRFIETYFSKEPASQTDGTDADGGNDSVDDSAVSAHQYQVGDKITLGHYEQDADTGNGGEPIEWTVLEVQGDRALVISTKVLDYRPYEFYDSYESDFWSDCNLREWLNGEFMDMAFTPDEREAIIRTLNQNPRNPYTLLDGGEPTEDCLFCLSVDEAEKYFAGGGGYAEPTDYVLWFALNTDYEGQASNDPDGYSGSYWLRTPGDLAGFPCVVYEDEILNTGGGDIFFDLGGVRPAMYISLDTL